MKIKECCSWMKLSIETGFVFLNGSLSEYKILQKVGKGNWHIIDFCPVCEKPIEFEEDKPKEATVNKYCPAGKIECENYDDFPSLIDKFYCYASGIENSSELNKIATQCPYPDLQKPFKKIEDKPERLEEDYDKIRACVSIQKMLSNTFIFVNKLADRMDKLESNRKGE